MARRDRLLIRLSLLAAVMAVTVAVPARAADTGDAGFGKLLAQTWCSSCHAISGAQRRSSDTAPPFALLVAGPQGLSDAHLRGWLHDPHPPMQGITLSRQQVDDIVAYLRSLASK